jgi:ribosome-associated protein
MNEEQDDQQWVSKSQLKRDSAALQDLAAELALLSKHQLNALTLPENVVAATCQAAAMPLKGARKRQLKYIGGLLRKMDVGPILEKLAKQKNQSAHATREHHLAESWRERLLTEGDQALTELVMQFSAADSQQLRQLIRNAKKEVKTGKPPKSSREIYRVVKALIGTES